MLNISDVRVNLAAGTDADKLKAYCSITIDECFMVRGIRLIDGAKGMFVAMPSRKTQLSCDDCGHKNPVSNGFCGKCGRKITKKHRGQRDLVDPDKLERIDVAHPLNAECRQQILDALLSAFSTASRGQQSSKEGLLNSG